MVTTVGAGELEVRDQDLFLGLPFVLNQVPGPSLLLFHANELRARLGIEQKGT